MNDDPLLDRPPPHNLESEMALLGSMMREKMAIAEVASIVESADFYRPAHGLLYSAMLDMWERGEPLDIVTLTAHLRQSGGLEECGGQGYLVDVYDSTPTSANALYYARIVKEKALLRGHIQLAAETIRLVHATGTTADEVLAATEAGLMNLSGVTGGRDAVRLGTILGPLVSRLLEGKPPNPGILTGFAKLDKETGGFHAGELTLLGAFTSIGKSTLSANMAEYAVMHENAPTLLFSLEMTVEEIALRIVSSRARVPLYQVRSGRLEGVYRDSIATAAADLQESGLFVDDTSMLRLIDIRSKVRRMVAKRGIKLVIVDYVQLVSGVRTGNMSRQEEVAGIGRGLKQLARECQVPVLGVVQLNRKAAEAEPELHHIKESGIEADADVVLLMNRELRRDKANPDAHRKTELLIAKQRNGRGGLTIPLIFHDDLVRFESAAPEPGANVEQYQEGEPNPW